jgi:hypothetical protein
MLSVDRSLQALNYVMYRDSKPCANVPMRALDKPLKPVDESGGYPQRGLYPVLKPCYQPASVAVIHRA